MTLRLLFIYFLFLLSLTGCFSDTNQQSEKYEIIYNGQENDLKEDQTKERNDYTIALVPKVDGIPYFNVVEKGALEAGEDLGVHVLYQGPLIADWKQQAEIIEDYIEMKVDAIAVSAIDPVKLGPILVKAKQNGIKVITWDSDTNSEYRELFINMVDPEILGRHIVDTLASRIGERGKYAILTDSGEAANTNEWIHWMKTQQIEYYPEMNLVGVLETNDNPNQAYMVATKLLKKYPDLKGIIGSSSVGPPAAAQAIKDLNRVEEVTVVGLSTPNLMRSYIKDGSAEIVTLWSPKRLGYLTVSVAMRLLEGKQITDNQELPNIGVIRVKGDTIIMGLPIDFTKENIDEYDF